MLKLVSPNGTNGIGITSKGVTAGRERGCDLMLCSKKISRQHARVGLENRSPFVEDLGSHNGTFVDGNQIQGRVQLRVGNSITFGDLAFELVDDSILIPALVQSDVRPVRQRDRKKSPLPETANDDDDEPKSVRMFAKGIRDKLREPPPQPVAAKPVKVVRRQPRLDESPVPKVRRTYAREACATLLLLILVCGFLLGRAVRGLGAFELYGENESARNRVAQVTVKVESKPDPQTKKTGKSRRAAKSDVQKSPANDQPANDSNQNALPNQKRPSVDDELDNLSRDDSSEPDPSAEMSISDSAKALKLMKEVKRLQIDMRDSDAVYKVAIERLNLPPDQAKRVVKFATMMAERKAIMDGGIEAINSLGTTPQVKSKSKPKESRPLPAPIAPSPAAGPTKPAATAIPNDQPSLALARPLASEPDKDEPVAAESEKAFQTVLAGPVLRGPGFYMNIWGLALVIGTLFGWLIIVNWLGHDLKQFHAESRIWLQIYSIAGPVGAIAALACPDLGWGTMLNSAALGAPMMAYIAQRDERVPRKSRILKFLTWFEKDVPENIELEPEPPKVEFLASGENDKKPGSNRSDRSDDSPGVIAAKSLITAAIARRASDIHLEPEQDQLSARFRIDGVMHREETYPNEIGRALINVFKVIASVDISERRRSQDGSFRIRFDGEMINVRVASQGTSLGEKISLRLLRDQEELTNLSGLGCNRKTQGELRELMKQPHGLFLVCGPTGAGKSTTLRSALGELDPLALNIITIENPVEYQIPGVTQIEINSKTGQTFATALRSVLRQDPDVLLVGEIRDLETATAACQAANTGHLVLSTVHANDTLTAINRLIDLGAESYSLADALTGVLGQRLIRRLCTDCKVQYQPDAEILRRYRIPSDRERVFFRPPRGGSDCLACEGIGYRGRIGIFELLTIDSKIRELIRAGASPSQIKDAARRRGMINLRESGFRLAIRGSTSLEEVDGATSRERM